MPKLVAYNYMTNFLVALTVAAAAGFIPAAPAAADETKNAAASSPGKANTKSKLDRSARKRVGDASIYSKKFAGKTMADGSKMDPHDDNAASKTLPLGTKAKVTNLETGQSAKVTIQDRGPYVDGRIVDLSPSTAKKIGLSKQQGVTKVEVKPLKLPMPDGSVKSVKPPNQKQ